jgi:long-chain acyl-CoA synthetase
MTQKTALDHVYGWEKSTPDRRWMTQPMGGDELKTFTWKEGMDEARRIAAYLESLDLPEKSHICIFSKNSAWWVLADLAIWMSGHVTIPLFATLTAESVGQILEHSGAKLIFIGKLDGFEEMAPGIPEDILRVTTPLAPKTDDPTWDDIIKEHEPITEDVKRDLDEMATIIYTSGSTGLPKGVMHRFSAMEASANGIISALGINSTDRMLSYLPLAHSFERWAVEHNSFVAGIELFFAESLSTFVTDLRRAEPTLFISVPRLWQKFQLGVFQKMDPGKLDFLLKLPIVKGIIQKKVLTGLGLQHVRFAGSGSAPIPAELIDWYRKLGLELLEGYGMSENFNYSHVSRPGRVRAGYVGESYPGVDVRISGEGEIQIKSPGNMMGYYKAPELTAEVLPEDDYLCTGDRGEIDDLGRLKITGRVKEIFKTSKGKYVAPAPIENELLLNEWAEAAFVAGLGQPQPFGLVMLSEEGRKEASNEAGRDKIAESVEATLAALNPTLDHHERLQLVAITDEEWTIENGLLTPTMKIKRAQVDDKYADSVQGWYDKKQKVLWA